MKIRQLLGVLPSDSPTVLGLSSCARPGRPVRSHPSLNAFILLLLAGLPVQAAFEEKPLTARTAGMGETGAALAGDVSAAAFNPAGLRFSEEKEITTGSARLFNLPELTLRQVAVKWPTARRGSWGLMACQFGSGLYQEQDIAIAQGFSLSSATAMGISIHRYDLRVERYGVKSGFGLDVGILSRVHPRSDIGASVQNLNGGGFFDSAEGPAQILRAGVAVHPARNALTLIDMVKSGPGRLSWRAGQEIRLARPLAFRFGVETEPSRLSLGMGLFLGRIKLDYAILTHADLPDQHHVTLSLSRAP